MLSKRLDMVASMVGKCDTLADIGTDHGYMPIYLIKNNIIKKAIAADISKGSCNKAMQNVILYHMENNIDVRCGNGLDIIDENDNVQGIVIAGMGGMLTIDILKSGKNIVQKASQLILQPQRDIDKVRKYIHSVGFKIENENMINEKGKFYTVIRAVKGKEDYSNIENCFGKILIERRSPVLREYAQSEYYKIQNILRKMEYNIKTDDIKYREFNELLLLYEEVLKCL